MYPMWFHVSFLHTLRRSNCWILVDREYNNHRRRRVSTLSKIQKETRSNQTKVKTRFVSSETARQDKANGHQFDDGYDFFLSL